MTLLALAPVSSRDRRKRSRLRPSALSQRAIRRQLAPKEPRAAELAYVRGMRALMRPVYEEITSEVDRYLRARLDQEEPPARSVEELIARLDRNAIARLDAIQMRALLIEIGARVDRVSAREMARLMGSPGILALLGSTLDVRSVWIAANVTRITSVPERLLPEVASVLRASGGLRIEEIGRLIAERIDVSQSRADFIARNETLTLYGQANRAKQIGAGVQRYMWSTSRDERVRPKHRDLEGTVHRWDQPPEVSGDGRREHPGGDYNCRCVAIPVMEEEG